MFLYITNFVYLRLPLKINKKIIEFLLEMYIFFQIEEVVRQLIIYWRPNYVLYLLQYIFI